MKTIIAVTAFTLMCAPAFAQNTGPAAQTDNMQKPGTTNSTMDKGSMDKGTTGMSNDAMSKDGMSKDGMKKDMSKDGGQGGSKKDEMKK